MEDWRMGLVFIRYGKGKKLGYRLRGGFGYKWLPDLVQRAIVAIWNPIACWLVGHDELD